MNRFCIQSTILINVIGSQRKLKKIVSDQSMITCRINRDDYQILESNTVRNV